ncbi:MAG: hypothetical protein ABIJ59_20895 [Pseudomonadota bacterium]
MQINPLLKKRSAPQGKLLITQKTSLPDGRFSYTGQLLGSVGLSPIVFVDSKDRAVYSVTLPPPNLLQVDSLQINQFVNLSAQSPEKAQKPKRLTPERIDKARGGIVEDVMKGATGITLTHVIQKGGAAVATPMVVKALGATNDPAATTVIGNIVSGSEIAKHAQLFGNFLKLVIFAGTFFGISLKLLGLFFHDDVPGWAWITSILVNLVLTTVFGLYLFDIGPFAPSP